MTVMARDREYDQLLEDVRGRKVLIWTCNTCARLCNIGGQEAGQRLADRLSGDGVEVVGCVSSSAPCFMSKADRMAASVEGDYDLVVSVNCDMGARNAAEATGKEVLNPVVTFGTGYIDRNGRNRLATIVCGKTVYDEDAEEVAERNGLWMSPFV